MGWLAVPGVALAWLLPQLPVTGPGSATILAAPLLCAVMWCLWGPRLALLAATTTWVLVRGGWVLSDRLAGSLAGADVLVQGTVCDFPRMDGDARRFVLERDADQSLPGLPGRMYLSWFDAPGYMDPGERWQLHVRLKPPRGLRNPGAFDFEEWLFLQGIGATGYIRASPLNRRLVPDPGVCLVGAWRGRLARRIEAAIPNLPATPYILGLVVGATSGLREDDWALMRRTGTTHLLAISGLNIAMVVAPILLLGQGLHRLIPGLGLRLPVGAGLVPALLAAALYTALAGFAVSTVRALVMIITAALYPWLGRQAAALDLLMLAGVEVVIADPSGIRSASFWLSFVAVAVLLLMVSAAPRRVVGAASWQRWPAWALAQGCALGRLQLVLGVVLAPLSLAWFQQISLIAPFTNLLAVPLFSLLILPLCLVGTLLLSIVPGAAHFLLLAAADILQVLLRGLRWLSEFPVATWSAPPFAWGALALAGLGSVGLCWRGPFPHRWLFSLCFLPLFLGARPNPPPGALRIVVLDVGQGLAVVVQTAHHVLLYDAGPAFRSRDAGSSVVIPVLRRLAVPRVDAIVISHPDMDHRGGAAAVVAAFPDAPLIAGDRSGLPVERFQRCRAGLTWVWDDVQFRMLSPGGDDRRRWSENDTSCVLLVRTTTASALLPGDIERGRETDLGRLGLLSPVDIVVAPHHGSRSSSTVSLIDATRPRYVVFSTGYRNRWGFPAREVEARWQRGGACPLNTAVTGALIFDQTSGGFALVRQERRDAAHLWTVDRMIGGLCER